MPISQTEKPLDPDYDVSRAAPLDTDDLRARLNGDVELMQELVTIFKREVPSSLQEIHRAIDSQDGPRLERAAHRLRGCVMAFGAEPAARAAEILESTARDGNVRGAEDHVVTLRREIQRLTAALDSLGQPQRP